MDNDRRRNFDLRYRHPRFPTIIDKYLWEVEDWNSRQLYANINFYLKRDSSCVNDQDVCGRTVLYRVLHNDKCSLNIVKLLLKYGANVNYKYPRACASPLCAAVEFDRGLDIIKRLLFAGARIGATREIANWRSLLCISFDEFFYNKCPKTLDVFKLLGNTPFWRIPILKFDVSSGVNWRSTIQHSNS